MWFLNFWLVISTVSAVFEIGAAWFLLTGCQEKITTKLVQLYEIEDIIATTHFNIILDVIGFELQCLFWTVVATTSCIVTWLIWLFVS